MLFRFNLISWRVLSSGRDYDYSYFIFLWICSWQEPVLTLLGASWVPPGAPWVPLGCLLVMPGCLVGVAGLDREAILLTRSRQYDAIACHGLTIAIFLRMDFA